MILFFDEKMLIATHHQHHLFLIDYYKDADSCPPTFIYQTRQIKQKKKPFFTSQADTKNTSSKTTPNPIINDGSWHYQGQQVNHI